MRYIDIENIISKIKVIEWDNKLRQKYSHLNHLVYIDGGKSFIKWEEIEKYHLNQLQPLTLDKKKTYIKKHTDWNIILNILIKEFGNKCWYSEAPLDKGVIDHFRPKSKAINFCLDNTDVHHKEVLKKNGYWWLAYSISNLRISSNTSNTRFEDMLAKNSRIGGKSIYFPLAIESTGSFIIAEDECDTEFEKPILLDPISSLDVDLISYDKNGEPYATGMFAKQRYRADVTINLYNLNNTINLIDERQKVWYSIENIIKKTKTYIDSALDDDTKEVRQKTCFETIKKAIDKKSFFSSTAYACFKLYQNNDDYKFLRTLIP